MCGSSARCGVTTRCVELHAQITHLRSGIVEEFPELLVLLPELLIRAVLAAMLSEPLELLLAEGKFKLVHFEATFNTCYSDLHVTTSISVFEDLCYVIHLYIIQVKLCRFTIFIMEPNMAP